MKTLLRGPSWEDPPGRTLLGRTLRERRSWEDPPEKEKPSSWEALLGQRSEEDLPGGPSYIKLH